MKRGGEEEWRREVEKRNGEEGWRRGMEKRDGEEEWRRGMAVVAPARYVNIWRFIAIPGEGEPARRP